MISRLSDGRRKGKEADPVATAFSANKGGLRDESSLSEVQSIVQSG